MHDWAPVPFAKWCVCIQCSSPLMWNEVVRWGLTINQQQQCPHFWCRHRTTAEATISGSKALSGLMALDLRKANWLPFLLRRKLLAMTKNDGFFWSRQPTFWLMPYVANALFYNIHSQPFYCLLYNLFKSLSLSAKTANGNSFGS